MTASSILTRFALIALAAFLPFTLSSCGGDPHEKAMKDMISVMNRMADTLGSVKDKATAEAAKDKLKSEGDEMKALKARMDKMEKPSEAKEKELKEKYEPQIKEAAGKMMAAAMKVATAGPEVAAVLKDTMEDMKNLGQ